MKISHNTVVSFHYRLLNAQGELIEDSRPDEPNLYLHGHRNIMPGLEQAMADKTVGDCFQATLEPHMAYGIYQQDKKKRVPIKYLKHEKNLKPGKIIRVKTDEGVQAVTVIKVGKFNVDVDFNHPLSGQRVTFDVEIMDIREATAEEIDHGHAHGVGGHQH